MRLILSNNVKQHSFNTIKSLKAKYCLHMNEFSEKETEIQQASLMILTKRDNRFRWLCI